MAKEVTVLSLEGSRVQGVRLTESNGVFSCTLSQVWTREPEEVAPDSPDDPEAPVSSDAPNPAPDLDGSDASVLWLADVFRDAASVFKTREFVLSVPLSRLLVTCLNVPEESREDLPETVQTALDALTPFTDETLAAGYEVTAETDADMRVLAAALPTQAAEDLSAALADANIYVVRTDATVLGRLRAFWPQICQDGNVARRLVLMCFGDEWDLVVLDDGAPVFMRGLGAPPQTPTMLTRDVTLCLLQSESAGDVRGLNEIVVVSETPVSEEIREALSSFAPVRTVQVAAADGASAEGVAQRVLEGATFDITPDEWVLSLQDARFKRKMIAWASVAAAVWLAIMGVFTGVPFVYGQMTAWQIAQSKRHQPAYRTAKSIQNKLNMVKGYSDRAHGALALLKHISDELPEGTRLREYRYTRDEAVFVQGEVDQDTIAYAYKNALFALRNEDESRLFPVVDLSGLRQNKFKIDASLKEEDEDGGSAR